MVVTMKKRLVIGLVALGLAACSDKSETPADGGQSNDGGLPPKICKTPPALGAGPYFKDVSKAWGLPEENLGNRLTSADINGDGFPDLIVHITGSNNRDVFVKPDAGPPPDLGPSDAGIPEAGVPDAAVWKPKRYRHILLNVASGQGRTFSEHTDTSKFFQTRDGKLGRSAHFAIFADVNNDGHLDAYSGTYVEANKPETDPGDRSEILLGDGKGGFSLAPKSDISHKPLYSTTSAAFLDYDRDGNVDLFVGFWYEQYGKSNVGNQDRLYRGNGDGTFTEVTDKLGLTTQRASDPYNKDKQTWGDGNNSRPTYGVTACDVDGDGDQDILVSAYGRQLNMLWRNDGTTFVNIGRESKFEADDNQDFSDDNYYRCYCKNTGKCIADPPTAGCSVYSWTPGFSDQPYRLGGNTFTTVCADVDNDGDMDLYNAEIAHWHIGGASDPSQLLLNNGKTPTVFSRPGRSTFGMDRPRSADWNEGDIAAAIFDFDGDGYPDVLQASGAYPDNYSLLFHQQPNRTFKEVGKQAGLRQLLGLMVTVADFDDDGDLDVVLGTSRYSGYKGTRPNHIYENLVGNKSNWLKVRLTGSGAGGANRSAIGAWVKATLANGKTLLREVGGGYGHYGQQNDLVLHFGLGKHCEVDKLEVRWPDKTNSTHSFNAVRANYLVSIEQKSGKLSYIIK